MLRREKMQQYQPIETPLGVIRGRSGIFLDDVSFSYQAGTIEFTGDFLTSSGSVKQSDGELQGYVIRFAGVVALKMIELDSWEFHGGSSFDEVLGSDWVAQLGGKVTTEHRHFLIQTYDDVFEIVCMSYEIILKKTKSHTRTLGS